MPKLIVRLMRALSERRRGQLPYLFTLMLVSAFAELCSVALVVPVITSLTLPERVFSNPLAVTFFNSFAVTEEAHKIDFIVGLAIFVVLVSAGIRLLMSFVTYRFAYGASAEMAVRVFETALRQPFTVHLARNSSEVLGSVNKSSIVVGNVLSPVLKSMVAAVTGLFILSGLLVIEPMFTGTALIGVSLLYILAGRGTKERLRAFGQTISQAQASRIQSMQESLGGIRDVILSKTHHARLKHFSEIESGLRLAQANNLFFADMPRYAVETIFICGIFVSILFLQGGQDSFLSIVPSLAAFAFAAQKLMPLGQQIYSTWSLASGYRQVVQDLCDVLDFPSEPKHQKPKDASKANFSFEKLSLADLSFRHAGHDRYTIADIDIEVKKGQRIGFFGETGSGKSTLIDIIMGFLPPASGDVSLDGDILEGELLHNWQMNLSLVPQDIFLSDSSIIENIAFGIHPKEIDKQLAKDCIQAACLSEFILGLPNGLDTKIGERGLQISGGERQRLGIARALYRRPKVLVLDEATSALDSRTEAELVRNLNSMSEDITVFIIAHRLQTLTNCDYVVELTSGRISRRGRYQDIFPNASHED